MAGYAVLEWEKHDIDLDTVSIIYMDDSDDSKETAEILVKVAPPHLHREVITMNELERLIPKE